MDHGTELGRFLRIRRGRLRPEDVGLTSSGRRRVPGLRREELARLAGVSVAYYTRLEQGLSQNASDGVLDAIARALRLDADEIAHLRDLARPSRARHATARPERLRPGLRSLIDSLDAAAYIVGRHGDILAWNRLAHALIAGHLDYAAPDRPSDRPNLSRLLFLDPHTRDLYVDWNRRAQNSVACLRVKTGRCADDPRLATLIGELVMRSPDFGALWSAHHVRRCAFRVAHYRHPLVGQLTLNEEVMDLPDDEQQVFVISADRGSPSHSALRILASLIPEGEDATPPVPVRSSR